MTQPVQPKGNPEEPNLSFSSAAYKVQWAEKQIDVLQRATDSLFQQYRESGSGGFDPQAKIGFIRNIGFHPFHACLAGDIIFSLRSALDCCWMGLRRAINANAVKDTLPTGPAHEVKLTIKKTSVETTFPGVERFLLKELMAHEGGNEILWFLRQADNWNKHNMLLLVGQHTHAGKAVWNFPGGGKVELENVGFGGFQDGFLGAPATGAPWLDDKSDIAFDVILKSRKPVDERLLMPFLRAALVDTRKGVDDFIRLFGKVAKTVPREAN